METGSGEERVRQSGAGASGWREVERDGTQ